VREDAMKHRLIIYGKDGLPEYDGPVPEKAVRNLYKWFLEDYKGLPSYNDALANYAEEHKHD